MTRRVEIPHVDDLKHGIHELVHDIPRNDAHVIARMGIPDTPQTWQWISCQAHRPEIMSPDPDRPLEGGGFEMANLGGDGSGYHPDCYACQVTARDTIAHILRCQTQEPADQ